MFSFLSRELPASGGVLYPGGIPPPFERFATRAKPITWTRTTPPDGAVWAAEVTHPVWGAADVKCLRQPFPLPDELITVTLSLTDEERQRARAGAASLAVRVGAQHEHVLRVRKRLLFWLRELMQQDGSIAIDDSSMLLWSEAMLDDELAHDADLDIESLYTIHAVRDGLDPARVAWLHTHGLEELGAFDIDVLQPSAAFTNGCSDAIRALAFAGLEQTITSDVDRAPHARRLPSAEGGVRRPRTPGAGEARVRSRRRNTGGPRAPLVRRPSGFQ